ncbi:ribonuclease H family protein [Vibrio sp. 10N.261.51.F12]|uniref:ribonuclease H family protein n=1 Tax=Vibrio sp. 10N.261.51.F12 TaxID=3229679 RepID=UPI00355176A4
MAKKYYVVWKGRETGIFLTWAECKAQVDRFNGARYKSFPTLAEAETAFGSTGTPNPNSTPAKSNSTASKKSPKANVSKANASNTTKEKLTQQTIDMMPFDIKIFTDGGCEPNPGKAGTGIAVYSANVLSELWYGKYQSFGTNNTAELNGLYEAMLLAKQKLAQGQTVSIYCDSMYAIQCITTWAKSWSAKGWKKSGGEIKNLDLIQPMYSLYLEIKENIDIYHVNGHVGIEGNELADRMSIVAIDSAEEGFVLYSDLSDIDKILGLRTG